MKWNKRLLWVVIGLAGLVTQTASAAQLEFAVTAIDASGTGQAIGKVVAEETAWGVLLQPVLHGLPPGLHGIHVHEKPNCGPGDKDGNVIAGLAAGGHYDPAASGKHAGPYSTTGHLGDLPPLYVSSDGTATVPLLAARFSKLAELQGHAVVIHAGGDNFSDYPEKLGGGGARIACGVIP